METQDEVLERITQAAATQSKNIDLLTDVVGKMADQLQERPTKKRAYGFSIFMAVVVLIFVGGGLFGLYQTQKTNQGIANDIRSCIDVEAEGNCAEESAKATAAAIGAIDCNQEKVVYFIFPEEYAPLDFCYGYINAAIDRQAEAGTAIGKTPKLDMSLVADVPQIPPAISNSEQ